MQGGMRDFYKVLNFKNKKKAESIKKELEDLFKDNLAISIDSYTEYNKKSNVESNVESNVKSNVESNTVYELHLVTTFFNANYKQLEEFSELVDKKLEDILKKNPNIFTNENVWKYITNGTTNND